jgi:ELWxxDGT repeat protein
MLFLSQNFLAQEIMLFKDLNSGINGSSASNFRVVGDNLYFSALNRIYVSNGENSDANIISSTLKAGKPHEGVVLNGSLYFPAQYDNQGEELCVVNGNTGSLVSDINPGVPFSNIKNLIEYQGKLFFSADNGVNGSELWVFDPTTNVASLLKDIREDSPTSGIGSSISNMTIYDNTLYFTAKSTSSGINELWKTEGTTATTVKVSVVMARDNQDDLIATNIDHLIEFNNELYFSALATGVGKELWAYNGTNNSARLVKDIRSGFVGSVPENFIKFNGELLLTARLTDGRGQQLYKTDGTSEGTILIKTLNPQGNTTVYMNQAFELNDKLYFTGLKGNQPLLFSTDGTTINTLEVASLGTGSNTRLDFLKPVMYNGKIYYLNDNEDSNRGIWETDGLENTGEEVVTDIFTDGYNPQYLTVFNEKLYFTAQHPDYGIELFTLTTEALEAETVDIPDDNFELTLQQLGLDSGDLDDKVLKANIIDLEELDLRNKDVEDLTGLEYFTALKRFYISNSFNLSNINISTNTNLEILHIENTGINNLDISSNANLVELKCEKSALTTIDISANFNLKKLYLNGNQFTTFELASTSQLEELNIGDNPLESISIDNALQLKQLFINNATGSLNTIDASPFSMLETIDVSNSNLSNFKINVGNITSFDARNNPNLTCIEIDDVATAITRFINKDAAANFSTSCNDTSVSRTFVPDDLFEQKLIELGYDDILDDYVITDSINSINKLEIENINIDDLTGLEAFVALDTLSLKDLSIDAIDLGSLRRLKHLNLFRNLLRNIDVSKNLLLEEFYASENRLTTLDLSNNTNLEKLGLNYNEFTSIDISNNTKLKVIDILGNDQGNQINSIDLSNNLLLEELQLQGNLLTSIDLSNNPNLIKLSVTNNNISAIDVSNNLALENLGVTNNNLSALDVSMLENLQFLYTSGNNLTCVSVFDVAYANQQFTQFADSTTIFVSDCNNYIRIPDENFEKKLIELEIDDVEDGFVLRANIEEIESLNLSTSRTDSNKITDLTGISEFTNLKTLRVSFHNLETVNLSDNVGLKSFTAVFSNINDILLPNTIEVLDLQNNNLFNLDVSEFINLERLLINDNQFEEIDLSANSKLKILNASNNLLRNLNLGTNVNLEFLFISNANLSELDVTNHSKLIQLTCHDNRLTSLDVSNNIALEYLSLSNNLVGTIDVSKNTALTTLLANSTNLSELAVGKNVNLVTLSCSNNSLSELQLIINSKLKRLNVSNNQIQTLNVSFLRKLEELNCSNNQISVLDITNNIRLIDFNAVENNLTCINVFDVDFANTNWSENIDDTASFSDNCYTTIADSNFEQALIDKGFDDIIDGLVVTDNVKTIKNLVLTLAGIEDLTGIENFTDLEILTLKGNNLESINLSSNTKLNHLNLSNNTNLNRLDISNNTQLDIFEAINTDLTCIKVWDVKFANTKWSGSIDDEATFNLDCDEVWTVEVEEEVRLTLGKITGIDKDNDGEITLKEAREFTGDLDLSNKNIDDIEGLQAFTNIKSLNLSGNNLKDLSALTGKKITLVSKTSGKKREVLAKASGLETLIISNNSFETLNLEELKNLKVLDLSNNPNVGTISIKNGNNSSITNFNSTNTPNLSCIIVDDKNAAYLANFKKDGNNNFVSDLADCRQEVLATEEYLQKNVKVFPNPVTSFLTVESIKAFDFVEIYNSIGKRLLKTSARRIDFSTYTTGVYTIRVISKNKAFTKKVIKNN